MLATRVRCKRDHRATAALAAQLRGANAQREPANERSMPCIALAGHAALGHLVCVGASCKMRKPPVLQFFFALRLVKRLRLR